MLSKNKRVITVASNAELLNKHYYRRLWIAARNLKIPRRKWLDFIADVLMTDDVYVIHPSGEPYVLPLVDDIFGDDIEMRWLSHFLRPDNTQQSPASFSRKLERMRLIDLTFRIRYPKVARHFSS